MALPSLEKTWEFDVNKAVGGYGTADQCNYDVVFQLKEALLGMATASWTVASSCGKNGGGSLVADLTDNWLTIADLVSAEDPADHAWIVLTNSVSGMQLRISLSKAGSNQIRFYISASGTFPTTGFDESEEPVATDQEWMGYYYGGLNSTHSDKMHVLQSTDGECMRMVLCRSGFAVGMLHFGTVEDTDGWVLNPAAGAVGGTYITTEEYSVYANWSGSYARTRAHVNGESQRMVLTGEYVNNLQLGEFLTVIDPDTSAYVFYPIGLYSINHGTEGRRGRLIDMWWGQHPTTGISTGDTYPSGGSKTFAQFGDFVLPWDGSTPQVT